MNIDRVNSGVSLPGARQAPKGVDLTISDQGVAKAGIERSHPPVERRSESQVTSSRPLQAVLSAEETRALQESFVPVRSASGDSRDSGVYNIRGTNSANQSASRFGSLVDFTG